MDKLAKPRQMSVPWLTARWREKVFETDFPMLPDISREILGTFRRHSKNTGQSGEKAIRIVLCHHKNQKRLADFFEHQLSLYIAKPVIERPKDSVEGKSAIDQADLVVLFFSTAFVETPELVEDANVALCRQRWTDRLVLLPLLLEALPSSPAYFNLFPCLFSITDDIWEGKKLSFLTRVSWFCTLNAKVAAFLDTTALFASFVATNSNKVQGSFKTLLSVQEIDKSFKEISGQDRVDGKFCNPMVFEEYKPTTRRSHSTEHPENEITNSTNDGHRQNTLPS